MKVPARIWMPRVGIVVIAALLVEAISIVQYERVRNLMEQEMRVRSKVILGAVADRIETMVEYGGEMDVSQLSDSLNHKQHFPSSFAIVLSQDGELIVPPPESRASAAQVSAAADMLRVGRTLSPDGEVGVLSARMDKPPYWQIGQVYIMDEVRAPLHSLRRQQVFMSLLVMLILFFMIQRFYSSDKKLREATEEQARIGSELAVAQRIQHEMLPKSFTQDVFGMLEPAREVGGDLFDFFRRDGKLFFCIGDASGKGIPSSLLMSAAHSLFRMVSQKEESPARILRELNRQMCRGNDSNMFATFFVGCLDLYSGRLHFGNAGHDKPFLVGDAVSLLPVKSNLPLGVFPDTEFVEETMDLSAGDTLFLYTDGLTEARNPGREAFGRSRLKEALESVRGKNPDEMVSALGDAVRTFAGNAPQSDDLTMLAVRFSPGNQIREHLTLVNDNAEVPRLGVFVKDLCAGLELDRKTTAGLRLALEEMVVNVMNYAYPSGEKGDILVFADSDRSEVRFTIVDSGVPFDPTSMMSVDTTLDAGSRPIGGLGIHITRGIMDSVSYIRKQGKNVLTLTKSII